MKREIQSEYINARIMETLEAIGYDQFNEDLNESKANYQVEFIFDSNGIKFLFSIEFRIDGTDIKTDSEYFGIDTSTHKEEEFKVRACSDGSKTLQDLFNEWDVREMHKLFSGYCDIDNLIGGRDYENDKENMSC